jgi:flagellar hook-basal body complex protein FliE
MTVLPVAGLGGEWSVGQIPGIGAGQPAAAPTDVQGSGAGAGAGAGGFGGALTDAISSLEQTQQGASSAAQGLAAGTVSDPETAIVTVQDAEMSMQLASQMRTKAVQAVQDIFQTQV